jgi:hypothetical protein
MVSKDTDLWTKADLSLDIDTLLLYMCRIYMQQFAEQFIEAVASEKTRKATTDDPSTPRYWAGTDDLQ